MCNTVNQPAPQVLADLAVDLGLQPGDPEYIQFLVELVAEAERELRALGAIVDDTEVW